MFIMLIASALGGSAIAARLILSYINGDVCESQECTEALANVLIAAPIYRKP